LHAILSEYDPKARTVTFQSVKFEGNATFRIRGYSTDLDSIKKFAASINELNSLFGQRISAKLFRPDAAERLKMRG